MKIFRIDSIYPPIYFGRKREVINTSQLSLLEYTEWIHSLKMYPGDGYNKGYHNLGHECIDHWTGDIHFTKKVYNSFSPRDKIKTRKYQLKNWKSRQCRHDLNVLRQRIINFHPDVIISHEHSKVPSEFYAEFNCTKISRISSPIPNYWNPRYFNGVITDIPSYINFIEAHKIPTLTIPNPISEITKDIEIDFKSKKGIRFIGTLGNINFSQRTVLYEKLAANFPGEFKWYGQIHGDISQELLALHQGITGGKELYEIYGKCAIVVNDYIDIQPKIGVNQRIYEAMASGALLITRDSEQLRKNVPSDFYKTYTTTEEMLKLVEHYLQHSEQREHIARKAQKFILEDNTFKKACSSICDFANSLLQ